VTFQFKHFLDLANDLKVDVENRVRAGQITQTDPWAQSRLRGAVSRAYYGAFREVFFYSKDIERDVGLLNLEDPAKAHQYIIGKYKSATTPAEREIGDKLKSLRKRRNDMDYSLQHQQIRPQELVPVLNEAKTGLANLDTLKALAAKKQQSVSSKTP
jgi:hypothetical protein